MLDGRGGRREEEGGKSGLGDESTEREGKRR